MVYCLVLRAVKSNQSSSHWTHPEFLQHNVHGHQFPQFLLQSLFGTLVHQVLQKRINGLWCSFIKSLMDGAGAKVQLVGHSPCLKPNYVWSPAPHMFPKGPSRVTPKAKPGISPEFSQVCSAKRNRLCGVWSILAQLLSHRICIFSQHIHIHVGFYHAIHISPISQTCSYGSLVFLHCQGFGMCIWVYKMCPQWQKVILSSSGCEGVWNNL